LLKHVEKPRSSALKSQKKQLLAPPAKAGGKEEPAEDRLKIAQKTMPGSLVQDMLPDREVEHMLHNHGPAHV
jgi:hypothetical protein